MKKVLQLFCSFFKIGLFTFGGGLAMLPMIESETVKKHGWVTQEDIMNMLIIAESTPGVVAVNSATFIGFKVCGFIGSLVATVAVV
ncbi:MAG: chromate transporter, partial [Christensenellales bacterium]